jgi:hypothetical protein
MPSSLAARKTRIAISERLATRILEMGNAVSLKTPEAGMLHPRRKFLTSCHKKFNFPAAPETKIVAITE